MPQIDKPKQTKVRKRYSKPSLRLYGSVRALTASGTFGKNEQVIAAGPICATMTTMRPCF